MPKPLPYSAVLTTLLTLLCWTGAVQSTVPAVEPASDAAAPEAGTAQTREDFIRETRVYFPNAVGKFYLDQSESSDPRSGVSLRYGYDGVTFAVDVFVFPIGRMSETQALDFGMKELLASFEQGQKLGYYHDVDLDRPRDIAVKLNPLVQLRGRQVGYTATRNGTPVVSQSLLVYRSYYLIKTRITAPKEEKAGAKRVAQQVAAELLPALRLAHIGSCAQNASVNFVITRKPPPKADRISADGSQAFVRKGDVGNPKILLEALSRRVDSACYSDFDKVETEPGEKFETLTFPAGTWRSNEEPSSDSEPSR